MTRLCLAMLLAAVTGVEAHAQPLPPGHDAAPVTVSGVVRQGLTCPSLVAPEGALYTLLPVDLVTPFLGARVAVTGKPLGRSVCQQGTTLEVTEIRRAD